MSIDKQINRYPLFVSYPRCGAHWINCVMELYFDRPRLRENRLTFLDITRSDWMWFHDHDCNRVMKHDNVLYLYRQPAETIFSNVIHDMSRKFPPLSFLTVKDPSKAKKLIDKHCPLYKKHLLKWLCSEDKANTFVNYNRFTGKHREEEFKKICDHFNQPFDPNKMQYAFNRANKKDMVKKARQQAGSRGLRGMRKQMLKNKYKLQREKFVSAWKDYIHEMILTNELKPFFEVD